MSALVDFPVVILAGGKAERFGSPKGLAKLGEKMLIEHVLENMMKQTSVPVRINGSVEGPYAKFDDIIVDDSALDGQGPVAGLLAALKWAERAGYDKVATVPVDAPFLPENLLSTLDRCHTPSFAVTEKDNHYVIGVWNVALADMANEFLQSGRRSAKDWTQYCGARPCVFEGAEMSRLFENINTPEDLERVQRTVR